MQNHPVWIEISRVICLLIFYHMCHVTSFLGILSTGQRLKTPSCHPTYSERDEMYVASSRISHSEDKLECLGQVIILVGS